MDHVFEARLPATVPPPTSLPPLFCLLFPERETAKKKKKKGHDVVTVNYSYRYTKYYVLLYSQ